MRLHNYISGTVFPTLTLANPLVRPLPNPTATLSNGLVIGTTTALPSAPAPVHKYLGIPFAAPPTRFSPPEPPLPWTQPLKAQHRAPACIQEFAFPQPVKNLTLEIFNTPAPEESEDCLYLNVYVPSAPAPRGGRAVLVWIYGGGLYFGDASHAAYDGSHFAAFEDVIVVAANYRTNVFGFPSAPSIPLEHRNLGFLDQRAALSWVQENIHAFGGAPSKVTISGESAGSFSVDALLTSYSRDSTPPFRAAIMQSGQLSHRGAPAVGKPYPDSTRAWTALVAALNCTGTSATSETACVSAAPAPAIKTILERDALFFWPAYDNRTLRADVPARRTAGEIARVPVLSGTNADEGRFTAWPQSNLTAYLANAFGADLTPEWVAAVQEEYPVGGAEYPTAYDAIAAVDTDVSFQCGAALVANGTAEVGVPSWRYYFNASFPNLDAFPDSRSYHSVEIWSVFSTYPTADSTAAQRALSSFMRGTWARFAKDPEAGPGWRGIDVERRGEADVAVFAAEHPREVKLVRQADVDGKCAFWADALAGKY